MRPQLALQRKNEFLEIGNHLAKSEACVSHLSKLCQIYATNNETLALFRHIIETKFKQDIFNFNLKHIEQWINTLGLVDKKTIIYCYSIIDLFKPAAEDDFLTRMLKLNAGIGIIDIFVHYNSGLSQTENKTTNNVVNTQEIENEVDIQSEYEAPLNNKTTQNFDGALFKGLLLEKISDNIADYNQIFNNQDSIQHLSYLVTAIRNVKNLENDINQVLPQLDAKQFNIHNPVANLKYKKKIIAHATLFLERIEDLHYKGKKQSKRLPLLSTHLGKVFTNASKTSSKLLIDFIESH